MNRPPPLQLALDNMLPNFGIRPHKPFFVKVYEVNWRPVVIALTTINTLRFALLASNSFHDQVVDLEEHVPNLARISFTLGVMYFSTCLMEAFGLFSSLFPRPCLVRFYTLFSFLSLVVVTSARTISAVGYFVFADDTVAECVSLASSGRMDNRSLFRSDAWHRSYNVPIPAGEAQSQCLLTWNSESVSEILSVIFFSLVPSTICFLVAWTWGRQVRDPLHRAYLGNSRSCTSCCCCYGGTSHGHGGRSAIRMEEHSPLYHSQSRGNTPGTAHSHHATTHARVRPHIRQHSVRAGRPVPAPHHVRRGAPPPLALAVPEMAQQVRLPVSVTENFQTMSPLDLESPSPYGVTPGPPSFAGGHADYSYSYNYEYQEGDYGTHIEERRARAQERKTQNAVAPEQPVSQVQRGRGEYWFV